MIYLLGNKINTEEDMKIDGNVCISCGACVATCPVGAISFNADGTIQSFEVRYTSSGDSTVRLEF